MKTPLKSQSVEWEYLVLAATLLLVGVIAAMIFPYCWFQADDFCRAAGGAEKGVFANVAAEFMGWSGRWLGIGIEYCVLVASASGELLVYHLSLALIALVYISCLQYLLGTLFPQLARGQRYLLAGTLFGIYWSGLLSTRDTIYWLCGSVEYQLSIALGVLSFAATLRLALRASHGWARVGLLVLATSTALAATGIHELYGLMLAIVMIFATLLAWWRRSESRWVWAAVACVALIGFLVVYFAPGNRVRIQGLENYGDPMIAFRVTLIAVCATLPDWIFDARLLLATTLFALLFRQGVLVMPWLTAELKSQSRWVVLVVWCILLAGAFAGPAWGTGRVVASRTLVAAYMIFLLGWFLNGYFLLDWLQAKNIQLLKPHPTARKALVLFFAASLLLTGNTRRAIRELSGPLQKYAAAKQDRQDILRKAGQEKQKIVVVPRLETSVTLLGFGELTPDSTNWINSCAAKYYGVKEIQIQGAQKNVK